jgi:signal transduction histidine kinase
MLQVSQLEAGLWQFKIQRLDVADLIHTVCTPLIKAQRPGQAALQVHIVDGLPAVTGDRRLLERVLTNLVSNAIKYTPVDGIITVSARAGSDGQQIEIEVRDTGQGIAPEALPHIFERFYQARSGDRSHGIGFGLYFSQLAVQAHGGAIRVDSAPGAGSSFVVTLPGAS